jgi:predicted RNA-binding protein YlxR (DUF448 family)
VADDATVTKHVPLRRCRVCRRQLPQGELRRWTLAGSQLVRDANGDRGTGRGYYTCSDRCDEILPKTLKKKG